MSTTGWKNNRGVPLLLLIAVVGIWGTVLYRIVTEVGEDAPAPTSVDVEQQIQRKPVEGKGNPYRGRFRDPFLHALDLQSEPDPEASTAEREESVPPPIQLQLVGIVEQTALLQRGGTTYLATAGEVLPGRRRDSLTVRAVTSGHVVVEGGERVDTLVLPKGEWAGLFRPRDQSED